jgi:hypothetical protein
MNNKITMGEFGPPELDIDLQTFFSHIQGYYKQIGHKNSQSVVLKS